MSSELKQPFELLPIFRERVWGRTSLAPYFAAPSVNEPIGEVWFTFSENRARSGKSLGEIIAAHPEILGSGALPDNPGICPLLVKLLFTTERLSVQVHPDDEYAAKHHQSLGKTEAWYILDSQPPGEVAVGFRSELSAEQFHAAVHSGVPAGTVHAIGAGVTVCEIQENSDITYRLYDYGRPRELHLEHGTEVSHLGPHTLSPTTTILGPGRDHLLGCDYFHIERLRPSGPVHFGSQEHYFLLVCTAGAGTLNGEPFSAGRTWFVPAQGESVAIEGNGSEWILTYTSLEPMV